MADQPSIDARADTQAAIATRAAAEQRGRRRHCCGTIALARMSLPAAERAYFAWVHDISENGIGLDVLTPLAAGADLVFQLTCGEDGKKIQLHAQVVHATPAGGFYRLGCRFTRPLQPGVLATVLKHIGSPQAAG